MATSSYLQIWGCLSDNAIRHSMGQIGLNARRPLRGPISKAVDILVYFVQELPEETDSLQERIEEAWIHYVEKNYLTEFGNDGSNFDIYLLEQGRVLRQKPIREQCENN